MAVLPVGSVFVIHTSVVLKPPPRLIRLSLNYGFWKQMPILKAKAKSAASEHTAYGSIQGAIVAHADTLSRTLASEVETVQFRTLLYQYCRTISAGGLPEVIWNH